MIKFAIHIQPTHALVVNDVVSISGLSTFLPNLTGLKTVGINTDTFNIYKDIPANASAGLVTDVYISNIPNSLSIGSTIGIGTELSFCFEYLPSTKDCKSQERNYRNSTYNINKWFRISK